MTDAELEDLKGYYGECAAKHKQKLETGKVSPESLDHLEALYRLALWRGFLELYGADTSWPFSKPYAQCLEEAKVYRADLNVTSGGNGLIEVNHVAS